MLALLTLELGQEIREQLSLQNTALRIRDVKSYFDLKYCPQQFSEQYFTSKYYFLNIFNKLFIIIYYVNYSKDHS